MFGISIKWILPQNSLSIFFRVECHRQCIFSWIFITKLKDFSHLKELLGQASHTTVISTFKLFNNMVQFSTMDRLQLT